jgi:hypothetical protein
MIFHRQIPKTAYALKSLKVPSCHHGLLGGQIYSGGSLDVRGSQALSRHARHASAGAAAYQVEQSIRRVIFLVRQLQMTECRRRARARQDWTVARKPPVGLLLTKADVNLD